MAIPYSDTFDNLDNWTIWNYSGATSSIESGRLKQSGSASGAKTQADFTATLPLDTECDVSVEIEFSTSAPGDYARLGTGYLHYIGIYNIGGTLKIMEQRGSSAYTEATETVPAGPVKVKLRRKADNKTQAYYDIGSGWTALGPELQFYASEIYTWVETKGSGSPFVAYYDNFQAGEPVSNDLYCPASDILVFTTAVKGHSFGAPASAAIPFFEAMVENNELATWASASIPYFSATADPVIMVSVPASGAIPVFDATTGRVAGFRVPASASLGRFSGLAGSTATFSVPSSGAVPTFDALVHGFATFLVPASGAIPFLQSLGAVFSTATNIKTKDTTEFANYEFDSFFHIGGKDYGIDANGKILLLSGHTDNGTDIDAYIESGIGTFGIDFKSNVRDVFMLTDLNGSVEITLKADEHTTGQTYTITGNGSTSNKRAKCALGVTGNTWKWRIANKDGAPFDLRRFGLLVTPTTRRT